jgi:Flp pilus assembly pilin Flp
MKRALRQGARLAAALSRDEQGSAMAEYAVIAALAAGLAMIVAQGAGGELATMADALRRGIASLGN